MSFAEFSSLEAHELSEGGSRAAGRRCPVGIGPNDVAVDALDVQIVGQKNGQRAEDDSPQAIHRLPLLDRMAVTADQYRCKGARSRATARWALLELCYDPHSTEKRIDADQRLSRAQTSRDDRRAEKGNNVD